MIRWLELWLCCWAIVSCGCHRAYYRRVADRDTHSIVSEKGRAGSWQLLPGFSIEPDRRSRFYDSTCPTDPQLPVLAPRIYGFTLPWLATKPADRLELKSQANGTSDPNTISAQPSAPHDRNSETQPPADSTTPSTTLLIPPTNLTLLHEASSTPLSHVAQASVVEPAPALQQSAKTDVAEGLPAPQPEDESSDELSVRIAPIPTSAWDSLPASCLRRMLEFTPVREEYYRSFRKDVVESQLDPAPRLTLENILELTLINSREYQTRKETLYRVALRLTLQRFDYQLKFFSRGNGSALDYSHNRSGGITVNTLGIPTGLGIEKSLYTAGDFAARFANDVVLTFNGSNGFNSSVSSQLLFDLSQPLIQRDVRFEALTQAERDVVYAARDFVRFRKILFRDLSSQYYNLLLSYRSIAINSQDYFSNLRGFNRAEAEFQAGKVPRFQVDQFEQNALRSSSNIVNSCNNLEGALDQLKFRIGIPTETPINVDLSELERLTLRDEATVASELVRRSMRFVSTQRQQQEGQSGEVLSPTAELARRLITLNLKRNQLSADERSGQEESRRLESLLAQINAEESRYIVHLNRTELERAISDKPEKPVQILLRRNELIESLVQLLRARTRQLRLNPKSDPKQAGNLDALTLEFSRELEKIVNESTLPSDSDPLGRRSSTNTDSLHERLEDQLKHSAELLQRVERAFQQTEGDFRKQGIVLAESEQELSRLIDSIIELSREYLASGTEGLTPVEIDMDEAMLTALVQRLDLMNRRAALADTWRQIKYAGDDLRSILNVRASESIRTRNGSNNPFDFTFDNSTTQLSLQFDAPLNRRAERNRFRSTLIDYNVALRNIIEAEDSIKLNTRNDIRQLDLDQNQYKIAIASAALAYDRVISTREQLRTGYGNITARDFLEAQQAYTSSLSSVAQQHIGYVVDRIQLFLDLEQLQVDEIGFWPELRNEKYPFIPNLDFPSTVRHPYDQLPYGPWYSQCLLRMTRVPSGQAASFRPPQSEPAPQNAQP